MAPAQPTLFTTSKSESRISKSREPWEQRPREVGSGFAAFVSGVFVACRGGERSAFREVHGTLAHDLRDQSHGRRSAIVILRRQEPAGGMPLRSVCRKSGTNKIQR